MLLDFRNISSDELWFASDILTRLHSCLNPVVYGVMNKQYRRSYAIFLSRMLCCSDRFLRVEQAPTQIPYSNDVTVNQTLYSEDHGQEMQKYPQHGN